MNVWLEVFHQPDLLKRLTFVSHVLTVAALTVSDLILIIIFFFLYLINNFWLYQL